ncbi:hypothetical protein PR202_gb11622 [Eleusine coracana subsp. coracana]|uniref:Uncharacterized protein n=1 Tax=Eleusine coracana subsp. coracana TaxID=191504 RepID=A0AAV5EMD4_ELECO|nr:hypothetical protein PR202_gb11622 [Eleusine coracana subsp. coracana]
MLLDPTNANRARRFLWFYPSPRVDKSPACRLLPALPSPQGSGSDRIGPGRRLRRSDRRRRRASLDGGNCPALEVLVAHSAYCMQTDDTQSSCRRCCRQRARERDADSAQPGEADRDIPIFFLVNLIGRFTSPKYGGPQSTPRPTTKSRGTATSPTR